MAEMLAPGFRFYPTEEELISFYLMNKLEEKRPDMHRVIPVINIHEVEPWQLPEHSGQSCRDDTEQWFFFMPRQEREARGGRPTRKTTSGYWKATGSPNYVYSSDNRVIGLKKTMVFYKGKAPTGRKTKWKMNEYRAIKHEGQNGPFGTPIPKLRHEFSLCRVYVTSGRSRSFDRRPAGVAVMEIKDQKFHENKTATSASKIIIPASSPEGLGSDRDNVAVLDKTDVEINNHINNQEEQHAPHDDLLWTLWEEMDWL